MSGTRRDPRHTFKIPVSIVGRRQQELSASCCDLSRSGVRVRVRLADLHLGPARFADLLEDIRNRFSGGMTIKFFNAGIHGARAVCKDAVMVRLVTADDGLQNIDIGCLFAVPLSLDEIAALGAPSGIDSGRRESTPREELNWEALQLAVTREAAERDGGRPAEGRRLVARPRQQHPAEIRGESLPMKRLSGTTELLTPHAIMVRIPRHLHEVEGGLSHVASNFASRFGERIRLYLGELAEPAYVGWARVGGFEVAHDDGADVIISLMLERPMDRPARELLGLDIPA